MKRLTTRTSMDGKAKLIVTDGTLSDKLIEQIAIQRLAEYEDTGLSPEEICSMRTAYDENQVPYMIEATGREAVHLYGLLQAEAEGRLIVLPCKVGDTVYVTEPRYYNGAVHTGIQNGKVYGFEFDEEWVVWVHLADDNPHSGNAYPIADIGKTVFLTREAAEKALKGE